jgi:hypothetical protein
MNTAPTRSNAPYGWTLLIMTVCLWFLPLAIPFPSHDLEWKILLISTTLNCLSLGLYMILPPEIRTKYLAYFGLIWSVVALGALAAIPVLQVLRTLRFIDVP